MAQISVDPDSLAADGMALINQLTGGSAPSVQPASAHDTSVGVAVNLTAQSQALDAYINNGLQKRNDGGATHVVTAASFRETEDGNAALISGNASTSGPISAPTPAASVSDALLPGIPPILPLMPKTGEMHATALHSGSGAGSLRALAEYWQGKAATLDNLATETSQASVAVNVHWSDSGVQTAGAKTAAHGNWWSETAGLCRALATVCNDAADQHDQASAAMPTPQEFTDAKNLVKQLSAANAASHGMLTGQLAEAQALLSLLHSQAHETANTHHTTSTTTVNSTAGQGTAAPSIAGGAGATGSANQSGAAGVNAGATGVNAGATGSAQVASNSALTGTGTPAGADSSAQMMQMAQMAQMAAPMAMMGGMAPMSALSGLGGMSRQNTPTGLTGSSGLFGASPGMDGSLAGDADTLAAGAGGGIESVSDAGAGAALPMASTSHAAPTAISGPAGGFSLPAESATTAAAGATGGGGGGMSAVPPMMGAPGGGDGGAQRNVRLFPDRRMVSRPTPNTEAVFGELERERRPRAKRAAAPEGKTREGKTQEGANDR